MWKTGLLNNYFLQFSNTNQSHMKKLMLVTFTALLFIAFKCEQRYNFVPGEAFNMEIGQKFLNIDLPAQLTITAIEEDSRCPKNVDCVWEGQVKANFLLITSEDNAQTFTLTLRADRPEESKKVINGYSYQLLKVDPYPEADKKINAEDYVLNVLVEKSEAQDTDPKF